MTITWRLQVFLKVQPQRPWSIFLPGQSETGAKTIPEDKLSLPSILLTTNADVALSWRNLPKTDWRQEKSSESLSKSLIRGLNHLIGTELSPFSHGWSTVDSRRSSTSAWTLKSTCLFSQVQIIALGHRTAWGIPPRGLRAPKIFALSLAMTVSDCNSLYLPSVQKL